VANDLATLRGKLALRLRDTGYVTWTSAEMDDLLTLAAAELPGFGVQRENDATVAGSKTTIVSGTYSYSLPTGMTNVYRIDIEDSAGSWSYAVADGGWELTGDVPTGGGKVRFPASVNDNWSGGKYIFHGYSGYDLTTNYPSDALVPLILAIARAEAYRSMAGSRARFEAWLANSQSQNVTVNELLQMVNEADSEVERLARRARRWHRPVPGRI
jgi:hypothetical protein